MGKVILVVDDDQDVREITGAMIESFGFEVVEAEDGIKGLQTAVSLHVDAVVTDIMMPGMNGYDLADQVRLLKPGLPIVCMSGFSSVQHEPDRCDCFLRKPFRPPDLENTLRRLVPE